jgi:four helix bundle protein
MNKEELKDRTKKLALDVIRFCSRLPQKQDFWVISKQLIRSATSVGANYRSACRAKSKLDFIAKLAIVE